MGGVVVNAGLPAPWLPAVPLGAEARRELREAMIFDHHKWDPQVGDTDVLEPTPLVLRAAVWRELARLAEAMDAEVRAAEDVIAADPGACRLLGLPAVLRRALRAGPGDIAAGPRVLRFDFHATAEGWRVSEVNSDVPGGYIEAGGFAAEMARRHPCGAAPAGDPARALAGAWRAALPSGGRLALVHATAYTDDRQVMVSLARRLEEAGFEARLVGPERIRWTAAGAARLDDGASLDGLLRFFPAEWLPNLGWFSAWRGFFRGGPTPQCNPPRALISQSKRFSLACARLGLRLPTWDALVPETRDPRDVRDEPADAWVLKPALGRVGDGVGLAGATAVGELLKIRREARRHPAEWAAQRRFVASPWMTADGARFPCLGVYVIEGRAAGVYGRAAPRPLIDAQARDVAVLVAPEE